MKTRKLLRTALCFLLCVTILLALPLSTAAEGEEEPDVFVAADLTIGKDLSIRFYVDTTKLPEGYRNVTVRFQMGDDVRTVSREGPGECGELFIYTGVAPQCMGDEITATVLYKGEPFGKPITYSVLQYYKNKYEAGGAFNFKNYLLNAMIDYGKCAEMYYNGTAAENTVAGKIENFSSPPYWAEDPAESAARDHQVLSGDARIVGVGVLFESENRILFRVKADDGLTFKINGTACTSASISDKGDGTVVVKSPAIYATGFEKTMTLEVYDGGVLTETYEYNLMAFIAKNMQSGNEKLQALCRAFYNYGLWAKRYVTGEM